MEREKGLYADRVVLGSQARLQAVTDNVIHNTIINVLRNGKTNQENPVFL